MPLPQLSKAASNGCDILLGSDADAAGAGATAMPVVREQMPQDRCGLVSIMIPATARQETAAKRVRDPEPGDAGPPAKRMRTTGPSTAQQSPTVPWQSDTGLLAMPDDVLLLILPALGTGASMTDASRWQSTVREAGPAQDFVSWSGAAGGGSRFRPWAACSRKAAAWNCWI
jgi:hypothetical protein